MFRFQHLILSVQQQNLDRKYNLQSGHFLPRLGLCVYVHVYVCVLHLCVYVHIHLWLLLHAIGSHRSSYISD